MSVTNKYNDSDFASINRFSMIDRSVAAIDVIDSEWMADTLSDDEIGVPEEHVLPVDESEVDTRDALDPARARKQEKWTEGLVSDARDFDK